ncbi:MAG: ribosome maturation factor RimP [Clostridiales Family XIII bacterium]|jgi:ribosome maturation factor RimP|nr:ribosome maturation factor RimP [Clostridiales Family XIII bacterium]
MAKTKVTALAEELLEDFLAAHGFELHNIEYVKEGKEWYLRVYIDRIWHGRADGAQTPAPAADGLPGVSLDDCELVSKFLSEKLDALDPIEQNYYLEVSSPGLDRELLREKDFIRFAGQKVVLRLYQPYEKKKTHIGTLAGIENDVITIRNQKGEALAFPKEQVAKIQLESVF